eukprot:m.262739 g.262739  ORF g.262739 m.262739 type:complete len:98 (+) comp46851_c0_seq1:204-497(+)
MADRDNHEPELEEPPLTDEQQSVLNGVKIDTRFEDEAYLRAHPEIKLMVSAFTKSVLDNLPSDVKAFAGEYFTDGKLSEKVETELVASKSTKTLDPF